MLKRIELVMVPTRGRKRTYAVSPLTVGPERWETVESIFALLERYMLDVERRLRRVRHIKVRGLKP
jgi:hypothetical protein